MNKFARVHKSLCGTSRQTFLKCIQSEGGKVPHISSLLLCLFSVLEQGYSTSQLLRLRRNAGQNGSYPPYRMCAGIAFPHTTAAADMELQQRLSLCIK